MSPPKGFGNKPSASGHGKEVAANKPTVEKIPREYFEDLKKEKYPPIREEEYTIDIVLDTQDLPGSAKSLKDGVDKIRTLSCKKRILGEGKDQVTVWQLHNDHHKIPFLLIRYTIRCNGKSNQFHCALEKSTLYICACTLGPIKDKVPLPKYPKDHDFRELPDLGDDGKLVRRFMGLLASNLSICYKIKPLDISFKIILDAIARLAGVARDMIEDQTALGVIFYITSEPVRFEPILEQLVRCIMGFKESVKEKTKFNFVLNWGKFCIAIIAAFRGNLKPLKALKEKADDESTVESGSNGCKLVKVFKISD